ncbi:MULTISPECIES: phosphoribosylanthranilate isomerase [Moraxella]|uniref:N-(5'-phosphoribosyl)anthranilate isomerase n=1 Tax=Moraxella lacunata TaxID=477 RepID=A0A1B8PVG6_MORLA|nr:MULTISPECIES: phosphoribosylanthranilate isomerase [Moraxella]MBE9579740.1 phosphoribosylanthranilate isomerase [Moraxella sp. K1664]MBE9589078.1 phosphoribosylanthranilate isomerase [Moraxella sp. K1630]MBE9589657.1 phosphoribosylanthranilate isomerase [Moraxella sp. K127]MBE9597349.1 phosphoribosylanthranilate isomerase [Moraxella sp. K2450]MDH9219862.1 phosphoribosylanthranilate isomerase [Moraxella lacunata]
MTQQTPKQLAVKFCGFTRTDDLQTATALGVNAVGLVFYPPSPRFVDFDTARTLVASLPPFVSVVALVVNMTDDEFIRLTDTVPFDVVQFHGDETVQDCQRLANIAKKRWYKAIRVQESDTAESLLSQINELKAYGASGVLLDAYHPDKFGGTGQAFDWAKIPTNSPLPIILAGGLTPDNVASIVQNELAHRLYGLDVSGGIEKQKGVKCGEKMGQFLQSVKHQ